MTDVTTISLGDLRVNGCTFELRAAPLVLELRGNAEATAADDLGALFTRLHEECVRVGASSVRIDLRELDFMSSSCFKSFVTWVLRIEELPEPERYAVVLVQSPAQHWQQRSLHALASMGPDVITVEAGAA